MTNSRNSAAAEEALKIPACAFPRWRKRWSLSTTTNWWKSLPKSIRMRKRVLNAEMRKKLERPQKAGLNGRERNIFHQRILAVKAVSKGA